MSKQVCSILLFVSLIAIGLAAPLNRKTATEKIEQALAKADAVVPQSLIDMILEDSPSLIQDDHGEVGADDDDSNAPKPDLGPAPQAEESTDTGTPQDCNHTWYHYMDNIDNNKLTRHTVRADSKYGTGSDAAEEKLEHEVDDYSLQIKAAEYAECMRRVQNEQDEKQSEKETMNIFNPADDTVDHDAIHFEAICEMADDYPDSKDPNYKKQCEDHKEQVTKDDAKEKTDKAAAEKKWKAGFKAAFERSSKSMHRL